MDKFHVSQVDNEGNPRGNGIIKTIWDMGLIVFLFLFAMMILSNQEANSPTENSQKSTSATTVVSQVEDFIGKTVTVEANQIESVGKSAFTVSNQENFPQKSILVINASGQPVQLPNRGSTNLRITGTVRNLSIPAIEREFNLDLQDSTYQRFQNQPVIIAQEIRPGNLTARSK
ncbi:hypothetical protein [Calothrix sp. NIES-3974]|uniref:hypothetical protein n=1 Tax=Calothrix sp. NIES-3974 TaxID=2005462 RepID=UPI000B5DC2F7|nr:hypothetical protein [Calothrix sp. NIES-3974]BAZ05910.1 hypothetical protein NIES3974_25660 [Calothrix sp. NIES-3974]